MKAASSANPGQTPEGINHIKLTNLLFPTLGYTIWMTSSEELLSLSKTLTDKSDQLDEMADPLDSLEASASTVGKAWSGSWLGYHARVYYRNFQVPPPGARFSTEWGLRPLVANLGSEGEWAEYSFDDVVLFIEESAGNPDTDAVESKSTELAEFFEEARSSIRSIISRELSQNPGDTFLQDLSSEVEKLEIFSATQFVSAVRPSGQIGTRDMAAFQQGLHTPPHIDVLTEIAAIRSPFISCGKLGKIARRAGSHIARLEDRKRVDSRIGTNVFIGHGRSRLWKDLKDFVQDRLKLPWDEFNHIPVAGITNIARLSQMLDDAALAFIVMTAEDEQIDGKKHARMNVIHEVGLFQGRLGFEKAIVVLEDGCEEFSNIQGLGQIRFRAGDIATAFEEIRMIAEREGLIQERN